MHKNGLNKKIRLTLKFMTSDPGKLQYTYCPNISRNKGNYTMRFGQLLKYNMRNSFLKKSYKKCGGETISRHFSKKSKLRISLDQYPAVLYSLFLLYGKLRSIKIY